MTFQCRRRGGSGKQKEREDKKQENPFAAGRFPKHRCREYVTSSYAIREEVAHKRKGYEREQRVSKRAK